jgi:hypothetical protein
MNGVAASLHRNKKGFWPPFLLITQVCKIENFKKAKEEVGVLASYYHCKISQHWEGVLYFWQAAKMAEAPNMAAR